MSEEFENYIRPGTDRLAFLQDYLSRRGVSSSVINIEEKKHLYVNFPSRSYNPQFKIKTLISHYDIVEGSPGANDNSAANFALADFAVKVYEKASRGRASNIRIFFTDGEELGEEGVKSQGAFGLAELFRKLGIKNDDVFVFDACGRGTVPVLARAGIDALAGRKDLKKVNPVFVRHFASLFERTQKILQKVSPHNWMTLPVPYSDNAGFLACGIPAVAITFLPEEEASAYYMELMKDKNLEKAVMNARLDEDAGFRFEYEEKMPVTWRLFHTRFDNILSLTPETSEIMEKILEELAVLYS